MKANVEMKFCKLIAFFLGVILKLSRSSPVDCGYTVGGPSNHVCPNMVEDDWLFICLSKNMNCRNGEVYHCAKNETGIWTEVCADQRMCDKGKEPLVTKEGNVVCKYCNNTEAYNPEEKLSNKFSYCPKQKTWCSPVKDGRSRIECENSYEDRYDKYMKDRRCRCNFEDDYIPYYYNFDRYNWTCSSFPEDLDCYYSPCENTDDRRKQKRGQGYRCFPVPLVVDLPGTPSNRPESTNIPVPENYTTITIARKTQESVTNATVVVKTASSTAAPITVTQNQSSEPKWIYGVAVGAALTFIGLFIVCLVYRYKRKKHKQSPVTIIEYHYSPSGDLIQIEGKQRNVNLGQNATTNYVTDTTDKTPAASPSQRKRKYLKQRKEPRPVSLNSEVSDVTVPLAPNEDPSVTPYISTDCMHSAKSDRLHENTNNSLNKRILAGHSRNPSGSRSFIDTPYMENTKANEEYARSVSESKLDTPTGFLSSVKRKLLHVFDRKPTSSSQSFLQKKLLETPLQLKEKKKNEEGYKRVLHSLIEVLKCNMDPEAVLDGLIKYEIGRRNNHMNIKDESHRYKKNDMILDLVGSSGFEAYKTFKKILLEQKHEDLVQQMNEMEKKILSETDDQSDTASEQDGPHDSDDDTHRYSRNKTGASPDNDLPNSDSNKSENQNGIERNDSDTKSVKEDGEKKQYKSENSDNNDNRNTENRLGIEDKTPNGTCRKVSDEHLSTEELKAKQYLLKLVGKSWDKLVKKAKKLQDFLKKELEIPASLATHIVSRVYKEGENSLPPDFEAHISSPDGNCLYNSVSLALFGDERAAYRLRLAAVCDGIINSKLYIKEHNADRNNVGSMMQFMQSRLTDESLRQLDELKCEDLYYLADFTIQMAVRETIKPGSYSSPLQVLFLSTAIGYTIHQYFQSGIANLYELPPKEHYEILPLSVSERRGDGCIRILWVTQNSRHFNHIVPVIEKISAEGKLLPGDSSPVEKACRLCGEPDSLDRTMIQCDYCDDWFHSECVRLDKDKLDCVVEWFCPGCIDVVSETPKSPTKRDSNEDG